MCLFFHKWTKWGDPEHKIIKHIFLDETIDSSIYIQYRYCLRCNIGQEKVVEEL